MLMLLPLLVGPALQMQAPSTTAEIEVALTDGLRTKLADGWTLVDVRGDYDEVSFTITKGTKVEAHVAHIDGKTNAYRIDAGVAVPQDPIAPRDFMLLALAGAGGIEIGGDCGRVDAQAYLVDAKATGAKAGRLIASRLKSSRDVEGADVEGNRAVFHLEMRGESYPIQLHVTLDAGIVVAAEARQYEYGADTTTFAKQSKLRRTLGTTVTSIEMDNYKIVLAGDKRFTIDLEDLERNFPDDHGCGC